MGSIPRLGRSPGEGTGNPLHILAWETPGTEEPGGLPLRTQPLELVPRPRPAEKVGLKLKIHKNMIMASGPITSWQIDGGTIETVTDFIWGAPKSLQMVNAAMKFKDTSSFEEKL